MENLTDLGVGAAVVLLILDRVFSFIKSQRNGHSDKKREDEDTAGAKNVEFWQREYDKFAEKIISEITVHTSKIEDRIMKRLDDVYAALQTLIRWKGGD